MDENGFEKTVREVQMLLPAVSKLWHMAMQQHLNEHAPGISGLQYGLMRMISMEPLTSSELSRKFQLDPSTLVPTVSLLERRGLIVRTRDSSDRRRQPLCLTESGEELVRSIPAPTRENEMMASMQQMGPEKTVQLLTLLKELIVNIPGGDEILSEVQDRMAMFEAHQEDCVPNRTRPNQD